MRSILLAIQFLTILPVRLRGEISESDIARCASFFPLAGALQGLILFAAAVVLNMIFPADIVSGFVIAIAIIINGGFHLDGLADTFDALAVKSSGDPAKDRSKETLRYERQRYRSDRRRGDRNGHPPEVYPDQKRSLLPRSAHSVPRVLFHACILKVDHGAGHVSRDIRQE